MIKIVVTGAESTGKSLLTEALAKHYQTIWVPELARCYVENLNRHYTYEDVEIIAHKQIEKEKNVPPESSLVFFDTWLIITKVWFEYVFGKSPQWLHDQIKKSNINLFLLCDTDIPWVPDPVRENGGESREKLQKIYIEQLQEYGFPFKIIRGTGQKRTENAIAIIDDFLKKHTQ